MLRIFNHLAAAADTPVEGKMVITRRGLLNSCRKNAGFSSPKRANLPDIGTLTDGFQHSKHPETCPNSVIYRR